jgi:hypothetical protein
MYVEPELLDSGLEAINVIQDSAQKVSFCGLRECETAIAVSETADGFRGGQNL